MTRSICLIDICLKTQAGWDVLASENDFFDEACEALYTYISNIAIIVSIRSLFTQIRTLHCTVRTMCWYDKKNVPIRGMW